MSYLREKDERCIDLCKLQSRLFGMSSEENIPSSYFVKVFANTRYCLFMDDLSFFYYGISEIEIFNFVKNNVKMNRGTVIPKHIMEWIGYLLREWCYLYEKNTKSILKKVSVSYLASVYVTYHSLDILKAIKMIAEAKGINLDETIEERVEMVLRTVR